MKLKSTLLSLAVAVAFTMPIDAAQYTVPEGQPPVPGADSSIPDTAYQNYRYGEALNANASTIILARKHIYEMLDKQVKENKRSAENAERWKKSHDTYMDISSHESTVILLHEGDHRAKMTVPIVVTRSFYKEAHKKNEASSFAAESSVVAGLVSSSESFVDDGAYKSAKQKGAFNYPGITKGYWSVTDTYSSDNTPLMMAAVTFDKQPNHNYVAVLGHKNHPITNQLERAMANFVIPSLQPIDDVDRTSDAVTWGNVTYRLPKGLKLKSETNNGPSLQGRVYVGPGMDLVVTRGPVTSKSNPMLTYPNRILKNFIHNPSTLLLQNVPIQSAMILNNGVPTYLIDQYNPGKQSRIFHLIQDDEYDYFMVLSYNDEKAKYNHMELRNMMEYLDFKNAKELRSKTEIKTKK
ncbi:MAG: hypothetical protein HXP23_06675 [Veillonella sp.]|uniref:hypothetical protein n=2 Tax=Veillonella sp. TaxID=1926307 RepID=UPI001CB577B5|nr:hypothetical protein [Veillonella sp.]MBF1765708.1 hypothetical protein [Veillonella sp.]MDU6205979.1 hypothetical protein [Veillonella sp.]